MSDPAWNIPVAFHFEVVIGSDTDAGSCSFTEVSGLNVKMQFEKLQEAGSITRYQMLPSQIEYSNLVLKRGLLRGASLAAWVNDALSLTSITPKQVVVRLLDGDSNPLVIWTLYDAYPVSMKTSPFNSTKNELVTEELELKYDHFERTDVPPAPPPPPPRRR